MNLVGVSLEYFCLKQGQKIYSRPWKMLMVLSWGIFSWLLMMCHLFFSASVNFSFFEITYSFLLCYFQCNFIFADTLLLT